MAVNLNELQALVTDWDLKNKAKDAAVLAEREAREKLVQYAFGEQLKEGSGNKLEIGFGMLLQVDHKISRKISDMALFEQKRASGEIPTDVVDALVRYKPELSISGWKNAPASARLFFADVVEEKPGTPSVKIVPQKAPTK